MSDPSPYEMLGLAADASFEEIQAARQRMTEQYNGDRQQVELIEAAYDAVLMDRLRMRREGKIKVPERIRFPEKIVETPPNPIATPAKPASEWLKQFLDTPSRGDILLPMGVFLGLIAFSVFATPASLQLALLVGLGAAIYFLNRKEGRFGRAVLLSLGGLFGGLLLGVLGGTILASLGTVQAAFTNQIAALGAFFILWLVSSFLR